MIARVIFTHTIARVIFTPTIARVIFTHTIARVNHGVNIVLAIMG
jgi:hypothetical protein